MALTPYQVSFQASLQAFLNCYLREVTEGRWYDARSWQSQSAVNLLNKETHVVELALGPTHGLLAVGVHYRSRVGRHTLTRVFRRVSEESKWIATDPLSAQLLLLDVLFEEAPDSEQRPELVARVIESNQLMAEYLKDDSSSSHRVGRSPMAFLESEQSTVLGHWLHPTPKSRQGIHSWQHAHYSPELHGRFQLHFFAVRGEHTLQKSLLPLSAAQISLELATQEMPYRKRRVLAAQLNDEFCLIPLHPLQAQYLLHQDYVANFCPKTQFVMWDS